MGKNESCTASVDYGDPSQAMHRNVLNQCQTQNPHVEMELIILTSDSLAAAAALLTN